VSGKHLRLALVLAGLLVSACTTHTERPGDPQELITYGQQVYLEYCSECHQTDGTGWSTLFPRLAGNPLVTLHDPEPVIVTVTYGQGSMTGFNQKLSSDDIASVISYIRNAWGNQAAPVSPRQIH
jgi:mono/diheme cytochrome c family protein